MSVLLEKVAAHIPPATLKGITFIDCCIGRVASVNSEGAQFSFETETEQKLFSVNEEFPVVPERWYVLLLSYDNQIVYLIDVEDLNRKIEKSI
jgi:hypothetical protein